MRTKVLASLIVIVVSVLLFACGNDVNSRQSQSRIPYDTAVDRLDKLLSLVKYTSNEAVPDYSEDVTINTLPDINTIQPVVQGDADNNIVIWTSPEKATVPGLWTSVVKEFNDNHRGNRSATLYSINSGLAADYIREGVIPDLWSPTIELWYYDMPEFELISERTAGNVAGIVSKDGLDTEQIIQNVKTGNIRFGYTNPYQSSTGLNFLMSFLDKHTVEEFAEFQRNIGVVAQTTLQLTSGSLDAWVSESQVFYDKEWDKSYKFVPFGVRHDEPLYKCNPISSDFDELVEALVNPKEESDYSFGYFNDYVGNTHSMTVKDALGAYSENKTGGRPVVAVFVCDTSGSMAGDRIYNLRRSLKAALPYITDKCSIGLVEFNSTINVSVPLARADADHKAKLRGAIGNMVDGGGTALWDAVLVAEDIIQNHVSANPGSVPKIFVLTDGDATEGYYYDKVKETLEGLSIPIYTFGYETNNGDISDVASLNEASYSNVDVNNVIYVISNFFKAEV